jgi:hypothetical protein
VDVVVVAEAVLAEQRSCSDEPERGTRRDKPERPRSSETRQDALLERHRWGGAAVEPAEDMLPVRPPTTTAVASNPESFRLFDALEERRLLQLQQPRPRGPVERAVLLRVAPPVVGATADGFRGKDVAATHFKTTAQASGGLPPVQRLARRRAPQGCDAPNPTQTPPPPPPTYWRIVGDPLPRLDRGGDGGRGVPAAASSVGSRTFAPSASAPELAPAGVEGAAELRAARDSAAFPSSVSHCAAPDKAVAPTKLSLRRPPALKAVKGAGLGFATGAPDLDDGAKRIPVYSAPSRMPTPLHGLGSACGSFSSGVVAMPPASAGSSGCGGGKARRPVVPRSGLRWADEHSGESRSAVDATIMPFTEDRRADRDGVLTPRAPGGGQAAAAECHSGSSANGVVGTLARFFDGNGTDGSDAPRLSREDTDPLDFDDASQASLADLHRHSDMARQCRGDKGTSSDVGGGDYSEGQTRVDSAVSTVTEVEEQQFVFGEDGKLTDDGFVITMEGVMEAPPSMKSAYRKGADDGEAPSSSTFIFVRSFDEFTKGPTLGAGAHGEVYLALHKRTNAKMAVKVIDVYDQKKRAQLTKELRTLFSHDNRYLVRTYGAYYDGEGYVRVTLEYMDRGALSDAIRNYGRASEAVVRHIARDCIGGLSYLHRNRVLHRDFKTANILLSRRARSAKLSDFGLVRDLVPGASYVETFVGTLAYMSPERLHGSNYTLASDVWGLGISLLECILGDYPFEKPANYFGYLESTIASPVELVGDLASADMVDFLTQCTHVEAGERATVSQLRRHHWLTGGLDEDMRGVGSQELRDADRAEFLTWLDGMEDVAKAADAAAATAALPMSPARVRADTSKNNKMQRKNSPIERAARLNS